MLSKQQLIHIATDAVLISLLFLYVNNKTKAVADAMDDLREYTEDQIESINNKLDTIISHMNKQQQIQQQYQQVQQYPQPKRQTYQSSHQPEPQKIQHPQSQRQQTPQQQSQTPSRQQPRQSKPPQQSQVTPQQPVVQEMPKFRAPAQVSKQVRFNTMPDMTQIDEFVNSIPSSFAFISTTTTPIITQQQPVHATNIEVMDEEENVLEEVSKDEIDELDENDIEEINNALGEDSVETDM